MPLLPIDLQIMFSQMSHVGKEQAVQRDVLPQYQFVQGTEMVQKAEHDDSAVNQSQQLGEGPEKVKGRKRRKNGGSLKDSERVKVVGPEGKRRRSRFSKIPTWAIMWILLVRMGWNASFCSALWPSPGIL